jgi:hypothetical protein
VGYVEKYFLHGLELTDSSTIHSTIHAAAQVWLDTIANLRVHGETQRRPIDLLAEERPHLGGAQPAPLQPRAHFNLRRFQPVPHHSGYQSDEYCVPAAYAHRRLTVKAYPDQICLYFDNQLIARHPRRYGRHEDIEDPDPPRV